MFILLLCGLMVPISCEPPVDLSHQTSPKILLVKNIVPDFDPGNSIDPGYNVESGNIDNPGNRFDPGNGVDPGNGIDSDKDFDPENSIDPGNTIDPGNRFDPGNGVDPGNGIDSDKDFDPANSIDPGNNIDPGNTIDPGNIVDPGNGFDPVNGVDPGNSVDSGNGDNSRSENFDETSNINCSKNVGEEDIESSAQGLYFNQTIAFSNGAVLVGLVILVCVLLIRKITAHTNNAKKVLEMRQIENKRESESKSQCGSERDSCRSIVENEEDVADEEAYL